MVLREALGAGRGEDALQPHRAGEARGMVADHEQVTDWEIKEYLTRF